MRPTLYDVAKLAGVSHMSVSRVVRGVRRVSPEMARKVNAAIKKLGYRPDPALCALAAYRSSKAQGDGSVLAFLDCDGTSYSRVVFRGVAAEARLLGYGVERFRLDANAQGQRRLNRMLFHRGIRGLLFGPSDTPQVLDGWNWETFAAVSLGAHSHVPALHAVAMDYFHGAVTACQQLRERGARRIGMAINPQLEGRSGHRWRGGFLANEGNDALIYREDVEDARRLKDWVSKQRIDAVITIHPSLGRILKPLKIPVAYLNDFGEAGAPHMSLDAPEIGAEGVRLLHHLLLRGDFGLPSRPKAMLLQAKWVDSKK